MRHDKNLSSKNNLIITFGGYPKRNKDATGNLTAYDNICDTEFFLFR